jgi:hypothetical protein
MPQTPAERAAAEQVQKEEAIKRFTDHWNKIGVMRNQFLAVPSMIGPVTRPQRNNEQSHLYHHF